MVERIDLLSNIGQLDNVAPGAQARVIPVTLIYGKNGRGEPRFQQICVF